MGQRETGAGLMGERWQEPPAALALPEGEVHVWRAGLDRPAAEMASLAATLSEEEEERADRFYFERDRQRFAAGRAILRMLLGHYLGMAADAVGFEYGPQGKPALAEGCGDRSLSFNLSHSHDLALFAFARRRAVGVDVERVRPLSDAAAIARRFFSSREVAALQAARAARQETVFFEIWTRKEAYIKALGEGLSRPLGGFSVALGKERAPLGHVEGDAAEAERWRLAPLFLDAEYVAAVAVEGDGWRLRSWDFDRSDFLTKFLF